MSLPPLRPSSRSSNRSNPSPSTSPNPTPRSRPGSSRGEPRRKASSAWGAEDVEPLVPSEEIEVVEDALVELASTNAPAVAARPRSAAKVPGAAPVLRPLDDAAAQGAVEAWRGRGIDAEGLVLNCTPVGLVDQLVGGDEGGIDATDRWGWSCLHKASIYGKADHVIALLDAGANPLLKTEHDPSQIYPARASALDLAECVQKEGWGDRDPIIKMLQVAASGRWVATRSEEERRKLKRQENLRLRQEQLERDIQMVAKGEALMRMKQVRPSL